MTLIDADSSLKPRAPLEVPRRQWVSEALHKVHGESKLTWNTGGPFAADGMVGKHFTEQVSIHKLGCGCCLQFNQPLRSTLTQRYRALSEELFRRISAIQRRHKKLVDEA